MTPHERPNLPLQDALKHADATLPQRGTNTDSRRAHAAHALPPVAVRDAADANHQDMREGLLRVQHVAYRRHIAQTQPVDARAAEAADARARQRRLVRVCHARHVQRRPERVRAGDERHRARVLGQRGEEHAVLRGVGVRRGLDAERDRGGEREVLDGGEVLLEFGEVVCRGRLAGDVRAAEVDFGEERVAGFVREGGDGEDGVAQLRGAAGDADDERLGLGRARGADDGRDGVEVEAQRVRGVAVGIEGRRGGGGGSGEEHFLVHGRVLGEAV